MQGGAVGAGGGAGVGGAGGVRSTKGGGRKDSSVHQKWTVAKDGRGSGTEQLRHRIICLISTEPSCWAKPKLPECNAAGTI